jgi:hypothetical protein
LGQAERRPNTAGVGPGSASALQQGVVALFVAGLGAIVVVGLVLAPLGVRPRD